MKKSLEELFKDYGVRLTTILKMMKMGFTVSTLLNMTEQEVEDLVKAMVGTYEMDLLVGERYGIRSAVRAEKKLVQEEMEMKKLQIMSNTHRKRRLEDISAQDTTKEQSKEDGSSFPASGPCGKALNPNTKGSRLLDQSHPRSSVSELLAAPQPSSDTEGRKEKKGTLCKQYTENVNDKCREYPLILAEPGELAKEKKNGLDYLFDLYQQSEKLLEEMQQVSRGRQEKCPTKI